MGRGEPSREELFALVWEKPALEVAKELGVSDVAIGKLCARLQVPKPPRGYWARVQSGRTPRRPPLAAFREQIERNRREAVRARAAGSLSAAGSPTRRWRSGWYGGIMAVMDQVLADRLPEVAAICCRHRVARLDVFGFAARQEHGAADLDFLVEFEDLPTHAYADAYFGLLSDLEALFERPVDLVMPSAVKNPFVRETIERSRIPLHAA